MSIRNQDAIKMELCSHHGYMKTFDDEWCFCGKWYFRFLFGLYQFTRTKVDTIDPLYPAERVTKVC